MIDQAQQSLTKIQDKYSTLLKYAENIQITNIEEQKRIEELSSELKFARKQAIGQMDNLLDPAKKTVKAIVSLFKPYILNINTLIDKTDGALFQYRKQLLETTDEELMARATDYWKKREEAKGTGEIVPLPDLGIMLPSKTSYHNMGSTSYRKHIKIRIIDPNKIPREYCTPSESLIRKAAELGITDITGAIIEIEHIPVNRSV